MWRPERRRRTWSLQRLEVKKPREMVFGRVKGIDW